MSQGQGPYALVVTEKKSLAHIHRKNILKYARGVLDKGQGGKAVPKELQVTHGHASEALV